jgi:hypothetical protein
VNFIGGLLGFVEVLIVLPEATDEDKRSLDQIKLMLKGKDTKEIEQTLASGIVKQDILDKIEKLKKDLVDMGVEHMTASPLAKEFLKKLSYYKIEQSKSLAMIRINELQIPIK